MTGMCRAPGSSSSSCARGMCVSFIHARERIAASKLSSAKGSRVASARTVGRPLAAACASICAERSATTGSHPSAANASA